MHHIVTPGFVDRPRRSDGTAGQMDGEAGWWTTSGNIGLPPLAMVMGVVGQQPTACLVQPVGVHTGQVICMGVVNKQFDLLEFVFDSVYVDLYV